MAALAACGNVEPVHRVTGSVSGPVRAVVPLELSSGDVTWVATTDATGSYVFDGVVDGRYVLVATGRGFTLSPTVTEVVVQGSDVRGVDLASALQPYCVAGRVSGGAPGTRLSMDVGPSVRVEVGLDAWGRYSSCWMNFNSGSTTVTPALAGCAFSPTAQEVSFDALGVPGQAADFVATCP